MNRVEKNLEAQAAEMERELDRALAYLPAVRLAPEAEARIRAAMLREADSGPSRRTSATWGRWSSAVAAGIALLIGLRAPWTAKTGPSDDPAGLLAMDAERELELWDAAVLVSGERFAALLTDETGEASGLKVDEDSIDQWMDSIDSGLSLDG